MSSTAMLIELVQPQSLDATCLDVSKKSFMIKDPFLKTTGENSVSVRLAEARNRILPLCNSLEGGSLLKLEGSLWKVLKKYLVHEAIHAQRWWSSTGPMLAVLLQNANYELVDQCDILLFYCFLLVPELGPSPDILGRFPQWKSFMTDDGMPIEMSWEWGVGEHSPVVRLSIEPIGLQAGTSQDPLNQFATNRVIENFRHLSPSSDLRLFHHFSKELLSYDRGCEANDTVLDTADCQSRSFVAFDFGKTGTMLKAYFVPMFDARRTGESTLELISKAIAKLSKLEALQFPAYDFLLNYLQTSAEGSRLGAEMLAIDCISPLSARIKVYFRSQSTSFDSVRANMTLDGKLKQRGLDKGILELEKLWKLVLLPAQRSSTNKELPRKLHRTAGILYYYDFRAGLSAPVPRVYIPVRHYGQNDMAIAEGLECYLKTRRQDETARHYMEALQTAHPKDNLTDHCGAQTYIGCTIVDGNLRITSYLKPKL